MTCTDCNDDLLHCHDVSVEHADGVTECLTTGCDVPHQGHLWQLPCSALEPPCPCAAEDEPAPLLVVTATAGEGAWAA